MKWRFESYDACRAYHARDDLLRYLATRADGASDFEAAETVFGELVANVVRHAPGPISIELYWDRETAVLRVRDAGPGFEWNGNVSLPEEMAECGRGLFIVNAVARTLRIRCLPTGGTEVTAWLPVSLNRHLEDGAI